MKYCKWTYDKEEETYNTGCGESFMLTNEDSLAENKMFFCVCCGKKIKEVKE